MLAIGRTQCAGVDSLWIGYLEQLRSKMPPTTPVCPCNTVVEVVSETCRCPASVRAAAAKTVTYVEANDGGLAVLQRVFCGGARGNQLGDERDTAVEKQRQNPRNGKNRSVGPKAEPLSLFPRRSRLCVCDASSAPVSCRGSFGSRKHSIRTKPVVAASSVCATPAVFSFQRPGRPHGGALGSNSSEIHRAPAGKDRSFWVVESQFHISWPLSTLHRT